MNIKLRAKKYSSQSHYSRYSSYAIVVVISPNHMITWSHYDFTMSMCCIIMYETVPAWLSLYISYCKQWKLEVWEAGNKPNDWAHGCLCLSWCRTWNQLPSTLRTLKDSGPALRFLMYAQKARPIQLIHPNKHLFSENCANCIIHFYQVLQGCLEVVRPKTHT